MSRLPSRRVPGTLALVLIAIAAAPRAEAFPPETRLRIVDEAIRLMPASLRLALENHREEVRRGALEPLAEEDGPEHRPPRDGGSLDRAVAAAASDVVAAVARPAPFPEVCRRFGRLAHFVTDAGFPPGASGAEGDARYASFSRYVAVKLPKFPLVFHGHEDPALSRGDFAAFARAILDQARNEDRHLARAYLAAGDPPDPAAFDDRSVPFAIASLSYSRSVTHVVRAWLRAWEEAGGDLGRTPYAKPPAATAGAPEE